MKNNGFSFAKLFIATLILGVILIIAIPNLLLRSPGQFPESAAIGNVKTVSGAQTAFLYAEQGYAGTWKQLHDDPITKGKPVYLDIDLSVTFYDYDYTLKPAGESLTGTSGETVYTDFTCIATPHEYSRETRRSFYVDSTGVIRWEDGKIPTKDSKPL